MFRIFLIILLIQLVMFLVAFYKRTDKLTDLSYGLTFVLVAWWYGLKSGSFVDWLLVGLINLWGFRLAGYLLIRIIKIGRDKRFDKMRDKFFKFLGFWLLQAVTIFMVMIPSLQLFLSNKAISFNWLSGMGLIVALAGLTIETVADQQKFRFKLNNPKKFISSGLWQYSRHANYFGELSFWWGVWVYVISLLGILAWWMIVGPLFITLMITRISGINLLEKRYDKKYKNDKDYLEYKKKTSLLVPWLI